MYYHKKSVLEHKSLKAGLPANCDIFQLHKMGLIIEIFSKKLVFESLKTPTKL